MNLFNNLRQSYEIQKQAFKKRNEAREEIEEYRQKKRINELKKERTKAEHKASLTKTELKEKTRLAKAKAYNQDNTRTRLFIKDLKTSVGKIKGNLQKGSEERKKAFSLETRNVYDFDKKKLDDALKLK